MAPGTVEGSGQNDWRNDLFATAENKASEQAASEWLDQLRKVVEKTARKRPGLQRDLRLIERALDDVNRVGTLIRCPNQGSRRHPPRRPGGRR